MPPSSNGTKVLITGITGQEGSPLALALLHADLHHPGREKPLEVR